MNYLNAKRTGYQNQDTRQNNPMQYIVTTYNDTSEARPTGNGRAEPRGILLIKSSAISYGLPSIPKP